MFLKPTGINGMSVTHITKKLRENDAVETIHNIIDDNWTDINYKTIPGGGDYIAYDYHWTKANIVGTMVDYLIRYYFKCSKLDIEVICDDEEVHKHGLRQIESNMDSVKSKCNLTDDDIKKIVIAHQEGIKKLKELEGKDPLEVRTFLSNEGLIYIYTFSLIEGFFRSGYLAKFNINDLKLISNDCINIFNRLIERIKPNKQIILNPTFGFNYYSDDIPILPDFTLKGDGDLIVDGVLIDLKCVKKSGFKKEDIKQLILYNTLNDYRGKLKTKVTSEYVKRHYDNLVKYDIKAFELYSIRYDYTLRIELDSFKNINDNLLNFIDNEILKLLI